MTTGNLMPNDEKAFRDICEALREQIARLSPGQWFEIKIGREQRGQITRNSVSIKPPHIFPVK